MYVHSREWIESDSGTRVLVATTKGTFMGDDVRGLWPFLVQLTKDSSFAVLCLPPALKIDVKSIRAIDAFREGVADNNGRLVLVSRELQNARKITLKAGLKAFFQALRYSKIRSLLAPFDIYDTVEQAIASFV